MLGFTQAYSMQGMMNIAGKIAALRRAVCQMNLRSLNLLPCSLALTHQVLCATSSVVTPAALSSNAASDAQACTSIFFFLVFFCKHRKAAP